MAAFKYILKSLRTSMKLTQDELAKKLNISRSTIGMYEKGAREPDFETLELIADFFNVDIDFLLGRTTKTTYLVNGHDKMSESTDSYYLNDDARELAEFMFKNPEYKVLFDASRKVKKDDIEFVKEMIDRMNRTSDDTGC